ncbi:hypothetical protein, partial [Peribacillus psychrosaccharolyticus]|uniref:hypothetical protein n=1 Tax=Peribacillus psychrosaccharolyticus TaxID=1407 RepID=UPI001F1C9502
MFHHFKLAGLPKNSLMNADSAHYGSYSALSLIYSALFGYHSAQTRFDSAFPNSPASQARTK